jgi:tetratricopeptide (TPR) repeat protein
MKWISLFALILVIGCAQAKKKEIDFETARSEQEQVIEGFEKANRLLDEQQYESAIELYDKLLVQHPTNQLDMLILFNSGLAHLAIQDCETAAERFRKITRQAVKNAPPINARAQLKMSDVYTCLGEDTKAITNLVELMTRSSVLPLEIAQAEIPAKLAAAYARIGNNKEAERYFRRAERGLLLVQQTITSEKERVATLARTLFLMGNLSQINVINMSSDDYFATIGALQKYLLKSVEFNDPKWSTQSFDHLIQAYGNTSQFIDRAPLGESNDPVLARREQAREKLRVAHAALESLDRLFSQRIPDPAEPPIVINLIKRLRTEETKLKNFVATNIVGTELTPEALESEGLKRVGRVLNPDPILEIKAMKRKKKK